MLIELEKFKLFLGSENTESDEKLTEILENAIGIAESHIGRSLERKKYEYEMDGSGERILVLKNFPISGDFSIKIHDQEVEKTRYHLKKDSGLVRFHNENLPRGFGIITVSYSAGYTSETLPKDLKTAILTIASKIKNLGNSGIKKERVDGTEIEFFENNSPVTTEIEKIFTNYRSHNV